MEIEKARVRLDDYVRTLVGQHLGGVAYLELAYDQPEPAWNRDPDFDSLDYGLELRFESGDACWISWGNDFYTYALRIEINTHGDRGRMRVWQVSETSRWRSLIGQEITGAQIYWDWQQVGSHPRQWGPQDLELTFQGGAVVFISALEIAPDHDPFGHTNNVTVIFDEHVARRYPVGPFARTPNTAPGGSSGNGVIR